MASFSTSLLDKGNFRGTLLVIKLSAVDSTCKGKVTSLPRCFLLLVVSRVLTRTTGGFKIEVSSFATFALIDTVFSCPFFMSADVLVFFELAPLSKMADFVFLRPDEVDV